MAAFIIYAALVILNKYREKVFRAKIVRHVITLSPIIIFVGVLCFFSYLQTNDSLRQIVDSYSSGRYTNARIYIENFPVRLFGNDITTTGITCDVYAIYLLYSLGIVGTIIYLIGFTRLIKYLYKRDNIPLILIFVTLFIYGIGEKLWIYPDYNIFVTAFSLILTGNGSLEEDNE